MSSRQSIREEVQAGGGNSGVFRAQMIFKVMKLNEITKRAGAHNQKKGFKDWALGPFNI